MNSSEDPIRKIACLLYKSYSYPDLLPYLELPIMWIVEVTCSLAQML